VNKEAKAEIVAFLAAVAMVAGIIGYGMLNTGNTGKLPFTGPILNPPWYQANDITLLTPGVTEVPGFAWYFNNVSQGLPLQVNITISSETNQTINVPMENVTAIYYNSTVNYSTDFPEVEQYNQTLLQQQAFIIQQQAFNYSFSPNQVTLQPNMSNSTILTIKLAPNAPLGQYTLDVNIGKPD
jgi:hypothetical protein